MASNESKTSLKSFSNSTNTCSEQSNDIKNVFDTFDTKSEGFIQTTQLKFAMRALGFEPRKEEINKIIEDIDKNSTGIIQYSDFYSIMSKRIAEKDINEEIMRAFQLFDDDMTGKISFDNLKNVAKELGENITDDELREMISEADLDGDNQINCDEFLRIMKKTCLY